MKKIIAWILAFLLAGALLLFCGSFLFRQAVIPAMDGDGAPVSAQVISAEKELIREGVTELAELYGFTAEPVIASVDDETLQDLNDQASMWWSSLLADGTPGPELYYDTEELKRILSEDPLLSEGEDADLQAESVSEAVSRCIRRVVLPMRQEVIQLGMKEANERVDLVNIIDFFLGVPWAALAASALLAGLIALLESRKISRSLKYIGAAAGAAALVLAVAAVLAYFAGVQPMIREASRSLAVQYDSVLGGVLLRTALTVVILAAACAVSLILYGRKEKQYEAAAD